MTHPFVLFLVSRMCVLSYFEPFADDSSFCVVSCLQDVRALVF